MVGLEPTTFRLTADRSTIELHAIMYCRLNHHTGLSSPYLYLLITRQRSWTRYRTSNGDSTPRAKLKSEYLTHERFFIGRGLPVLCWWISPASAALPTLELMGIEPKPLRGLRGDGFQHYSPCGLSSFVLRWALRDSNPSFTLPGPPAYKTGALTD